jgi:hypothetical protein
MRRSTVLDLPFSKPSLLQLYYIKSFIGFILRWRVSADRRHLQVAVDLGLLQRRAVENFA